MNVAASHAAVVLAAGGSRRLGRPKQMLTRDGETLVHRAVRLAQETSPRRLLAVVGAYREQVAAGLSGLDCDIVANPDWERGLAGSLRAASIALGGHEGAVLVVGCDQPALSLAQLHALLEGAATASSRCAASLHDGLPGIPAVVPHAWLSPAMAGGDRGFGARLRGLPPAALFTLDAPELGFDLDTEHDVGVAIARGWVDPPFHP